MRLANIKFNEGGTMYVIGISGSPRKEGNTAILVKEVLNAIKGKGIKKKFISLASLNINPCDSCDRCWKENRECVIDDDVKWIIKEMIKADVIILGSPCYFGNVSAQLKILMDRTVSVSEKGVFKNKIGAAVVTQDVYGSGRGGELVRQAIAYYITQVTQQMIYAGGIIGEGGTEVGYVKKDKRAMKEAKELAERIMELYRIMRRKKNK
jgi:multimeric flavodoxin WrbA